MTKKAALFAVLPLLTACSDPGVSYTPRKVEFPGQQKETKIQQPGERVGQKQAPGAAGGLSRPAPPRRTRPRAAPAETFGSSSGATGIWEDQAEQK
ncbi:MAG TPA: hypothetical protein VM598_13165 [Bdellovibrionota bacterium]|nr:hypothetical protein [Bdellovibrionota bacterium]